MKNVWKLSFGTIDPQSSLLTLTGAAIDTDCLSDEPCPLNVSHIETEQVRDRFVLRLPLEAHEHLYGL